VAKKPKTQLRLQVTQLSKRLTAQAMLQWVQLQVLVTLLAA
jgi:hypothetical protein